VANDIALPSYAYRRGSVQEKLPPSVMYRKMLKDSIINTVGLDPVMIEVTRYSHHDIYNVQCLTTEL